MTDEPSATEGYATAADGVRLSVEDRGAGAPVLVVQGGPGGARATPDLVAGLAATHRVITYDRRGLGRSDPHPGPDPVTLHTHAADAAAVLAALDAGPAAVVGASIGALIALHLAVDDPDRVGVVVAHEPPMSALVRDDEREQALDEVARLAREEGPVPAAVRMGRVVAPGAPATEPDLGAAPRPTLGDLTVFFAQDFPAVRASTLLPADLPAGTRLVPARGALSIDGWEWRCAGALARARDLDPVELPGGHDTLVTHPRGTVEVLRRVLAG